MSTFHTPPPSHPPSPSHAGADASFDSSTDTPPPAPDPSPLAWGPNLVVQPAPDATTWVVSALVGWQADAPDPRFSLDGEWVGAPQVLAEHDGLRWGRVVFRLARQRQGRWVEYRWGFPGLERRPGAWDGIGLGRSSFHVPALGQAPRVVLAQVPGRDQDVQAWAQDILVHGDWPSTTVSQCDGPTLSSSAAGPVDVLLLDGRMASLAGPVFDEPMVRAWLEAPLLQGQPPALPSGMARRLAQVCIGAYARQVKAAWQLQAHVPHTPDEHEHGLVEAGLQACHLGARLPAIWSQAVWQPGLAEEGPWPAALPPDDPRLPLLHAQLRQADRVARRLFLAHQAPEPHVRLADEQARLEREWGLSCSHRWGDTECWVLDPEAAALQDARCTRAEAWLAAQALGVARSQCPPRDADGLPVLRHGDAWPQEATGLDAWTRPWVSRWAARAQAAAPVRGWCLDAGGHLPRLQPVGASDGGSLADRMAWWAWPAKICPPGEAAGPSGHPEWEACEARMSWSLVEVLSPDAPAQEQGGQARMWPASGAPGEEAGDHPRMSAATADDMAASAMTLDATRSGASSGDSSGDSGEAEVGGLSPGQAWAMRWWWRWRPQAQLPPSGPGWSHTRGGPRREAQERWPLAGMA